MDASPARQAASSQGVNGSVRRLARWPANSPGGHSGNIAASQPADSSPAGWSASQQSRQPAGHQPEGRQAPIQSHNRRHPQSHFDDTITQNARFRENPGRNKNWANGQTPEGKKLEEQPAAPASWPLASQARQLTASLTTVKASGEPTGWPLTAIGPAS